MSSSPATREEFKEYCLRALGKPVIKINIDDSQVEDRVQEALRLYWDYHFDGSDKTYFKHQVTAQNKTDRYIELPENIIGAVKVFPIGGSFTSANNMFSYKYQFALNEMHHLLSQSLVPYYMSIQHINLIEELLVGMKPIRFNRHMNRLYIDMDWDLVADGDWIIVEAYEVADPELFPDVWSDRWLLEYATALIKRQWGVNLSKFTGVQMAGGVTYNADGILSDAEANITRLREELERNAPILSDFIG